MAKIKKLQEGGATIYPATITNAVKDPETGKTLPELLGDGVQSNGTYPKMTVGFAQDIVGDGSATPEEFSFRPTAGEERNVANTTYYEGERNGVARIEKVKGNSEVWNQQAIPALSVNNNGVGGWRNRQGTAYISESNGRFTMTLENSIRVIDQTMAQKTDIVNGHTYLIIMLKRQTTLLPNEYGKYGGIGFCETNAGVPTQSIQMSGENIDTVSFLSANKDYPYVGFRLRGEFADENDATFAANYPLFYDLTQMFGAGNEPTTIEEFYQRLPEGVDINAYNAGEIIDGNYGSIKTVGFNAFNGTYAKVCGGCPYYLGGNYTYLGFTTEKGGTLEAIALPTSTESVGTTPSDRLYTPSQNGYIYAEGENININLSWDTEYGYLNGTYQPYKPFTRDLSWVNKYFPATINGETKYGMRSAGGARDEIRFNSTTQKWEAVPNVGVVDLGSLTWGRSEHLYGGSSPAGFIAVYTGFNYLNGTRELPNLLCNKYTTITANEQASTNVKNLTISAYYVKPTQIHIIDDHYTEVDAFTLSLSGVMLNYELAEPIVTEIDEDIDMDFDVSDYGTEELIVAEGVQSAPIVADITYAPNALSTIKQVPDILQRLKALESAVAQQTTTITNEEETVE